MSDDKKPKPFSTRDELEYWKADRKNDQPYIHNDYPRPSWMVDPYDEKRRHIRMRERRIRHLENRLNGAVNKMERDFDQSS